MNIVVPTSHLENVKDINGNSLSSLVTNEGSLNANGGVVQLSGQTAENLMLGSVNIGSNGIVSCDYRGSSHGKYNYWWRKEQLG